MFRAPSLSIDFFNAISETLSAEGSYSRCCFNEIFPLLFAGVGLDMDKTEILTQRLLFDFSHTVGMADARNFMKKMNLGFGPEGLSAGPVHFSYTGWAVVQLHDSCRPSPNEDCYLFYDHPFSFESYSWSNQLVPHNDVLETEKRMHSLIQSGQRAGRKQEDTPPPGLCDERRLQQWLDW